jgi:hypothetical protein
MRALLALALGLALIATAPTTHAAPSCPTVRELAPTPSAPLTAAIALDGACARPARLTATASMLDGTVLGTATVAPEATNARTFRVDLQPWRTRDQRAGVYRIRWTLPAGGALLHEQRLTVACPAPPTPVASVAERPLSVAVGIPPGDRCEGDTSVSVELIDAQGRAVAPARTQRLAASAGGTLRFDLEGAEASGPTAARVALTNATGETTLATVPLRSLQAGAHVSCGPPVLEELAAVAGDRPGDYVLVGRYAATQPCHGATEIHLQLRDAQNIVVFNRTLSQPAAATAATLRVPLPVVAGAPYELSARVRYGPGLAADALVRQRIELPCAAPAVIDLGYADPAGTQVTALVQLSRCNLPASARVSIRDAADRVLSASDVAVTPRGESAFATLEPLPIANLRPGSYTAHVIVRDRTGRSAERSMPLARDLEGPAISLLHGTEPLAGTAVPVVRSLADLSVSFSDPSSLLSEAQPSATRARPLDGARAVLLQVSGEADPELSFVGYVDVPRAGPPWAFTGVLVENPAGDRRWLAPVGRRFVVAPADLGGLSPAIERAGFRAVVRTESLPPGAYRAVGVVLSAAGQDVLAPTVGAFTVSARAARRPDAVLRQGVTEIPVRLAFEREDVATLQALAALSDGNYTLELIARDRLGNASAPQRYPVTVSQDKSQRLVSLPALAGHTARVDFIPESRGTTPPPAAALRVAVRRVGGRGAVEVNGARLDDAPLDLLLAPDRAGRLPIRLRVVDPDLDTRLLVIPEAADLRPLELALSTYRPEFGLRRQELDTGSAVVIENRSGNCGRHVVFSNLQTVSVAADEVVCALRIGSPEVTIAAASGRATAIGLPPSAADRVPYAVGFVQSVNGVPTFTSLSEHTIGELQSQSRAPRLDFEPAPALRDRGPGLLTRPGPFRPGVLLVSSERDDAIVEVNGVAVPGLAAAPGVLRVPLETAVPELGGTQPLTVKAYYAATPTHVSQRTFTFTAVPPPVLVTALTGSLVLPSPLSLDVRAHVDEPALTPAAVDAYAVRRAVVAAPQLPRPLPATATARPDGTWSVSLPDVAAGAYRLQMVLEPRDPRLKAVLSPTTVEAAFTVVDGRPVDARIFTFKPADVAPFTAHLTLQFARPERRMDVARIVWEVSEDGKSFHPYQHGPTATEFALPEPMSRLFRARIVNRHSQAESVTRAIAVDAVSNASLTVAGPNETFRGYPVELVASGAAADRVLWRVLPPGAQRAEERRGERITVDASATGTYYVEVIAGDETGFDAVSAPRVFKTLHVRWPTLPPAVVTGPSALEVGRAATFEVREPPLFTGVGNPAVRRLGEWLLPGGRVVAGSDAVEYTLATAPPGDDPVAITYRSWLDGARDRTTVTTVHRVKAGRYRWPEWRLVSDTVSPTVPSTFRVALKPARWQDWLAVGDTPVETVWQLPTTARVRYQSNREVVFQLLDNRPFDVSARVSDARGNVAEVTARSLEPTRRVPFAVAARVATQSTVRTVPLRVSLGVEPVYAPKHRSIIRVAYYLGDQYLGATSGAPLEFQITKPGTHRLRAIASLGADLVAEDTAVLEVGDNVPPRCRVEAVGDFTLNGIAKAVCEDPDGQMSAYRWYLDGQPVSATGSRVQLTRQQLSSVSELSVVGVDNAGKETTARLNLKSSS